MLTSDLAVGKPVPSDQASIGSRPAWHPHGSAGPRVTLHEGLGGNSANCTAIMIPLRDNIRTLRPALINWAIIAACIGVFLWQIDQPSLAVAHAFVPRELFDVGRNTAKGLAAISGAALLSMFMHGGLLHLAGNMLFLWVFGDNVEDRLGRLRYLLFYFTCGLLALAGHCVMTGFSDKPIVGASGAIAGVLGGYWVLFRGARIRALVPLLILWFVMDVPAWFFLAAWFALQFLAGLTAGPNSPVASWAHIAGFAAGALLVKRFLPRRFRGPRVVRIEFH